MTNFLVTGGGGCVGSELCAAVVARGDSVVARGDSVVALDNLGGRKVAHVAALRNRPALAVAPSEPLLLPSGDL
jgi:nucleoside-diphosphate-sugar epimerase